MLPSIVRSNYSLITIYIIIFVAIGGRYIGEQKADLLATLYDVGGILGKSNSCHLILH